MNEEELARIAGECGYKLVRVVRFPRRDRIVIADDNLTITLYLKCKIEDLTEDQAKEIFRKRR